MQREVRGTNLVLHVQHPVLVRGDLFLASIANPRLPFDGAAGGYVYETRHRRWRSEIRGDQEVASLRQVLIRNKYPVTPQTLAEKRYRVGAEMG